MEWSLLCFGLVAKSDHPGITNHSSGWLTAPADLNRYQEGFLGSQKDNVRAKRRRHIPVVLSREEINAVMRNLSYPYNLVVKLLYGCGLRLFECLNLRVHNFNFDAGVLTVREGKGKKDRTVPLPQVIVPELKAHIENIKELHQKDINTGYAGAFVDGLLEKKYKGCGKEFIWQWFFPAKSLTFVPDEKQYRRYHLYETHLLWVF